MRVVRRIEKLGSRLWVVFAVALVAGSALAAPLRDIPQTMRQPDGTVVHLLASGDEYYNRLHDARGFTVVRDPVTGFIVYAQEIDGRLQPTGFIVGRDDPAAAGLTPDLMPDPRTLPSPDELYPIARRHAQVRTMGLANAPAFSSINNLVVFISFADEPTPNFQTIDTYTTWFDSTASKDASLKRYFLEASYGAVTIDSSFYPTPNGTTVVSYQDPHNRSYYKPYNAVTNPDGYQSDQRNAREWTLLQNAVNAIAAQVPTSLNLDTNNDGYIDSVVFIVSGSAVNADWSNLLWPHRWAIDDTHYPARVNGKLLGDYNLQLDGNMSVGVLCHEMTHLLGAPDLYRYSDCSSASSLDPVGPWDLMAIDKDPPQHMSAYLKWRYLGFISSIPAIGPGSYTLNPLTSATDNCYRIASPNSTSQYFVVEYRKRSFPFENSLPASGLLVYRIDTAADGRGDQCGPPDEVYVYRPGGTLTAEGFPKQANFAADTVPPRTAINDATDPAPILSDGFPGGLSIHDIGAAGSTIGFTVDPVAACTKPGAFALVSPANGAGVTGTSATLVWDPAAGADSYDVYFGTDPNPPLLGNQSGTSAPVTVTGGLTYFWRVAARNACAQVSAPTSGTWAFVAGSASGGITIFSDDFEGDLSKWKLGNTSGASATAWGVVSCKTKDGNAAVWCAGGGSEAQPACTQYAPGEGTFLIAGPFDLSEAVDGTWDFDLWTDIDDGGNPNDPPDIVYWMWSLDGRSYSGYGTSGNSGGWEHKTIKMSDMTMSDNVTSVVGKPKVYFAFLFMSDATTQKEGAYVDNVVIKKIMTRPAVTTPRVRRHLPRR